ncbi:MAG: nitrite reductase [Blastopirellula sp.]|nr:MAG: nitrite reductase [Blastopirellula sp.]
MSKSLAAGFAFLVGAAIAAFAAVYLLVDVFEKKQEARQTFFRVVELTDETEDPAIWGKNFPLQYDDYLKTVDMEETLYGGSEAIPRTPTEDDPRSVTSRSVIEQVPELKRMWAGYAFSKDYREKRGHAFMLEDQIYTERQKVGQPGTCVHCHASMYAGYMELGHGDLVKGFEAFNKMSYEETKEHLAHPVGCIDCHDPKTMALRISRPSFMEGIAAYKNSTGIEDYDVNRDATHQQMRSYVCAQCHVEYYFKGEDKRLVYPWSKGLKVEEIYEYFQEEGFTDWTHAETGGKMLKAQHPEFELWKQGIHHKAGVSCSDCHMPYKRVGASKISDHHLRSPLLNINRACQTCHKASETELISRVETIQGRTVHTSKMALKALVELIDDINQAKENGMPEEELATALEMQRKASFYVDFVKSENSAGFHADQEAVRILADAMDFIRQGQLSLRELKK